MNPEDIMQGMITGDISPEDALGSVVLTVLEAVDE